jgi:hypothetical protein
MLQDKAKHLADLRKAVLQQPHPQEERIGLALVAVYFLSSALIYGSAWIGFNARSFGLAQIILVLAAATFGMGAGALIAVGTLRHWSLADEKAVLLDSIFSSAGMAIKESRNELRQYALAILICWLATYGFAKFGGQAFNLSQFDTKSLIHVVALGPAIGVLFFWFILILWTGIVGNSAPIYARSLKSEAAYNPKLKPTLRLITQTRRASFRLSEYSSMKLLKRL